MKPTRVLQVLTAMNRGGAETMVMNYYRAMNRNNIQFDFIVHREEVGIYETEILSLGGKIFRMPALSPSNYFKYIKSLNIFFQSHPEYNVIHSHMNAYSYLILKIAKKNNVSIRIAHSHTSIEPFFKKIFLKNTDIVTTIKDSVQSVVRHFVPNVANYYFSCGQKAGIWLFGKKNYGKVTIINNAVNSAQFSYNLEFSKEYKKILNLQDKEIIGHVGNFVEAKNHIFLIHVFKKMLEINNNLVLLLVGQGYLKNKIQEEVKKLEIDSNVRFLGVRDDIPNLMQAFDLFLFPSLYEGLPLTMVEAQASGLKIIASDTITSEVKVTNLVTFCSLDKPENYWAELALKNLKYNRRNTHEDIVDGKYDIEMNAKNLYEFYCNN
tara:strand:+ start:16990 stop:18126 length:1137 start_codon:yes stop_codon:yes gene_type:complete